MSDVSDQRKYYERMMDEVGAEYRRRIADLQAENDKLREELDAAKHDLSVFSGEIVASKAENAKLRELLSVMAYCNQFRRDCDGCSMNGAAGIITERAGCDELLERLRELGVEVDG